MTSVQRFTVGQILADRGGVDAYDLYIHNAMCDYIDKLLKPLKKAKEKIKTLEDRISFLEEIDTGDLEYAYDRIRELNEIIEDLEG